MVKETKVRGYPRKDGGVLTIKEVKMPENDSFNLEVKPSGERIISNLKSSNPDKSEVEVVLDNWNVFINKLIPPEDIE